MNSDNIGHMMGHSAVAWWQGRGDSPNPKRFEALNVLDVICAPFKGSAVEFDAVEKRPGSVHPAYVNYTDPDGPLGRLIVIAFPAESLEHEHGLLWFEGSYQKFIQRFNFRRNNC